MEVSSLPDKGRASGSAVTGKDKVQAVKLCTKRISRQDGAEQIDNYL
jgi:hypothetical protein